MSGGGYSEVHRPVLVKEVLEALAPGRGEVFVDLTLGAGGHALEIARLLGVEGTFIGMDFDAEIIERAKAHLAGEVEAQCHFFQGNFAHVEDALEEVGVERVDGIFLDLGVSSLQLDDAGRGFSFSSDGPLDMRMNAEGEGRTAEDIVNRASAKELERIFREYGEERLARRIAGMIEVERRKSRIERTSELARIASRAYGRAGGGWQRIHPATRIFQALRIEVNGELENLKSVLAVAPEILGEGGRIGVIAFHSLEDRIVKEDFRSRAGEGIYRLLTKKPVTATEQEVAGNPRARSARLRSAQRSVQ